MLSIKKARFLRKQNLYFLLSEQHKNLWAVFFKSLGYTDNLNKIGNICRTYSYNLIKLRKKLIQFNIKINIFKDYYCVENKFPIFVLDRESGESQSYIIYQDKEFSVSIRHTCMGFVWADFSVYEGFLNYPKKYVFLISERKGDNYVKGVSYRPRK